MVPPPISAGSAAPIDGAAWVDLVGRGTVLATGADAVAFIDKFTTAAVARLEVGHGSEGFFADVRGWVLAFAVILRTDEGLTIDVDEAATAADLREHLEHYHIREALSLDDASVAMACMAIVGPDAVAWLGGRIMGGLPEKAFAHTTLRLGPCEVQAVAVDWFGPAAFLLRLPAADAATLRTWLSAEGLPQADAEAFEALRIEHRLPTARDIPEKTLPQELDRTARAISFTKGCYLGQETVARIDALGHVNRELALVVVDGDSAPPLGAAVVGDGEPVGTLTSACLSPRLGPCGLALVHRRVSNPDISLAVAGRAARIVAAG